MNFRRITVRRDIFLAGLMVVAACGASSAQGITDEVGTVPGVGVLPAGSSPIDAQIVTTSAGPTTTLAPDELLGRRVIGNRVLVIGDSILAATAPRYSNSMCEALVPLDWQVEVEAETARFIDFGRRVLHEKLAEGWDVVVVFLGTNFSAGTIDSYRAELDRLVLEVAPRPMVLLTATQERLDRQAVNDAIRATAIAHDNVLVLDWGAISVASPEVLSKDGIHPSDHGRVVLAESVASVLGPAPVVPGTCLKSTFTDDSAGNVNGANSATTVPRRSPTPTTARPAASTTTTKPSTTTAPATTQPPLPTITIPLSTTTTGDPATTEP